MGPPLYYIHIGPPLYSIHMGIGLLHTQTYGMGGTSTVHFHYRKVCPFSLGWSDLALWAILVIGDIAVDQVPYSFKCSRFLEKFIGTIKMCIFGKICKYPLFTSKNNRKKGKFVFNFCCRPQKWTKVVLTWFKYCGRIWRMAETNNKYCSRFFKV